MTSAFRGLCAELTHSLTPALASVGFAPPIDPFSTHSVRYDYRRPSPTGAHTFSVLFNKYRHPQFGVQLFIEPVGGLTALQSHGGTLLVGGLSPSAAHWPFGVQPFVATQSRIRLFFSRREASPSSAVQSALALLPEVELWWETQRSTRHILTARTVFKARAHAA